ncbi:MAG TPA: response regulator [Verrucomicrobiae bacterium]|jgi:CheY-like chemotaxis protein|nr:response regulator [Verrucomicrobiae bacterium]
MNDRQTILMVDDSDNDLDLMRIAFAKAGFNNPLQAVHNGEEAIAYLKGEGGYCDRKQHPLPAVILLDLNMPRKSGFDVLAWIRAEPGLQRISIIILTASLRMEDVERTHGLGANAFLVKPATLEQLTLTIRRLKDWLEVNHFPPHNEVVNRH